MYITNLNGKGQQCFKTLSWCVIKLIRRRQKALLSRRMDLASYQSWLRYVVYFYLFVIDKFAKERMFLQPNNFAAIDIPWILHYSTILISRQERLLVIILISAI
jgi:hypothetical protein